MCVCVCITASSKESPSHAADAELGTTLHAADAECQDRQGLWIQLSPPFCWSVSRAMPPVLIPTRLLRALANLASVSVSFAKALPMTGSSPVADPMLDKLGGWRQKSGAQ